MAFITTFNILLWDFIKHQELPKVTIGIAAITAIDIIFTTITTLWAQVRRKEANANERNRIRQFNAAMTRLRQVFILHFSLSFNDTIAIIIVVAIVIIISGDWAHHSPAPAKGKKSDEGDQSIYLLAKNILQIFNKS